MAHPGRITVLMFSIACAAGAQNTSSHHPVADAKREYAAVFAHPDQPCKGTDDASYIACMSKELDFTQAHLDAYMTAMRGAAADWDAGGPAGPNAKKILDELNRTDTSWRAYKQNACSLQVALYQSGTGGGPASLECALAFDRTYIKMLYDFFNLHQMASD
jgi:uncharacterized protein YecT (DUF1311 family)